MNNSTILFFSTCFIDWVSLGLLKKSVTKKIINAKLFMFSGKGSGRTKGNISSPRLLKKKFIVNRLWQAVSIY
ncbi:hypothetical protein GCM10011368_18510 [Hyunsoonleella pacifica]|nr:hypothetical protein GCM10011368_18510 [Hyunsoonleella pacifica]